MKSYLFSIILLLTLFGCTNIPKNSFNCEDGSIVSDISLCPKIAQEYVCPNGTVVSEESLCQPAKNDEKTQDTQIEIEGFLDYENPELGIKIKYPQEWTLKENHSVSTVTFYSSQPETAKVSVGVGTRSQLMNFARSAEDFAQLMTVNLYYSNPLTEIIDKNSIKIGNNDAYQITHQQKDGSKKVLDTILLSDDKAFVITYEAEKEKFDEYLPQIQQMINNFDFFKDQNETKILKCLNGTIMESLNECLDEKEELFIIGKANDFALEISEIEPGFVLEKPAQTYNLGNIQESATSYAPEGYDYLETLEQKYRLVQITYMAYGANLEESIKVLENLVNFDKDQYEIVEENFVGDVSKLFKNGKNFTLQFREKNVLTELMVLTKNQEESVTIEKLKEYAKTVYDKIGKAERVKPVSTDIVESIFGTCQNNNTCSQDLFCNNSSFCSMTENGVVCSQEGDQTCHRLCLIDKDCQKLCEGKLDCDKYIAQCNGAINIWSGDTVSAMQTCLVFEKN